MQTLTNRPWVALASSLALAAAVLCACPERNHPEHGRVRFMGDAAMALAHHASPLFGDDAPPELAKWFVVESDDVASEESALVAAGARETSREPEFVPAVIGGVGGYDGEAEGDAIESEQPVDQDSDDIGGDGLAVEELDDGPSCPVKTPQYDDRQGYRRALGVDAAWTLPGGRGQGVGLADVEGEWNDKHEDLPGDRIKHIAGRRQKNAGWRAHGTAVLGVVAAKDNGAGMLGLAPEVARIHTASLGMIGAARALYEAAKSLSPGDVLIVELHGPGPNADGTGQKGFVPMEWWQPEYDAIHWATQQGVIVVEAGGNGGEDLDAKVYKNKFNRSTRDSGAILVGAGAPPNYPGFRERARLDFSNHGSRVDVQGWGRLVATLDYGDLQGCSTPARKYTALFSGTSSASPVVAGAAAVIQGVSKARGRTLTPTEMRALLVKTGTPQVGRDHIGPLPHVERAIAALAPISAPTPTPPPTPPPASR